MKAIVKISELDSARVLFKDMTQRVEPPSCRIYFLLDLVQQIYASPQRERPDSRRKLVEDHLTFSRKKQICNGLSIYLFQWTQIMDVTFLCGYKSHSNIVKLHISVLECRVMCPEVKILKHGLKS